MAENDDPTLPMPDPDPGELLARAMHTEQPSGGAGGGRWVPPTPEELAALLPQYRIESLLGKGGMGAVYKGVQAALKRPVAIKLLPLEISADPAFAKRFEHEAQTLAKLSHPNIVGVYDFGTTSAGHLYFVMEFVEGTDLHRMIHGPGLNPAQSLSIIIAVCEALQYAHGKGVVHRDIKPANVLVNTEGTVKVADFGLARLNTPDTDSGGLTMTGTVMGTPAYMAPEQTRGLHVDHRADIYSLGVMLYEMLCGQIPRGVFAPPSHRVQVDVRLDEVVLKAMQSEPERRYQNTVEMKTDVDRIRTTPAPSPAPAPKPKSKPLIAAAVIAMVVGIIASFAFPAAVEFFTRKRDESSPGGTRSVVSQTSAGGDGRKVGADGASPSNATKDAPFVNTLGMKFVPVPITGGPTNGQHVFFSVWETRVRDFEAFVKESRREWSKRADVDQEPNHAVVSVNWDEAQAFCAWLTERDRKAGRLNATESYRLPSDHEWSCAVGIGDREDPAQFPSEKHQKLADVFPWGTAWPPPANSGNYWSEELRPLLAAGQHGSIKGELPGYTDGQATVGPVGSYVANGLGLHDLGGNAWEWCENWWDKDQLERVLRGASWTNYDRSPQRSSHRHHHAPTIRYNQYGFRVVLASPTSAP